MEAVDKIIIECLDSLRITAKLSTDGLHKHLAPLMYRLELNIKKKVNRLVDLGQAREDAACFLADNDKELWPIAKASGIEDVIINAELGTSSSNKRSSSLPSTSSMATAPPLSDCVSPQF
mmetsp:Transcript_22625/g.29302  ORF Transcript_22625/g.29302 Transcript_22625/m.29302 type:complete len:120 (+) Transcript_22625:1032-1391(+)